MTLTYNGKPFRAGEFQKDMMRQMRNIVAQEMQKRISAIRHPESGEFPVVAVRGGTLDDLRFSVEGSPELIAHIRERLPLEEVGMIDFSKVDRSASSSAFLSYASEDRDLAGRIAQALHSAGIETWWDQWEIGAGDSIVQKVNIGLGGCSHFIVLLTPKSIGKPWVQTEMDAGFVRKVSGETKFIALRSSLSAEKLPALLRPLHSPDIGEGSDEGVRQLVSDIYGLSKKPVLGAKPRAAEQPVSPYSAAAMAVAEYFCKNTKNAVFADPQTSEEELAEALALSVEDVQDALYELRNFFKENHFRILPDRTLWAEFDKYFIEGADPAADALQIAVDLMNDPTFPSRVPNIAERYSWTPRRLNPALSYLVERDIVKHVDYLSDGSWATGQIDKTAATRRFVKSRS